MTWKIDDPQGNEAAKIRWEIVPYTRGRVLDVGCGMYKAFPHFIGVDNCIDNQLFGHQIRPDVFVADAADLAVFADDSCDAVFSSHLLEHIEPERVVKTLKEWLRVVKPGGHLVLYLPDETLYPKVGEKGANPDHKWNVSYTRLVEMMKATQVSWDLLDWQRRDEGTEYSLLFVFKKRPRSERTLAERISRGTVRQSFSCTAKKKPAKSCGVVRYGAFGDLLQASSVFAALKAEGYHVTLYTAPPGDEVVRHDPNIDAFYVQDKDQVPNQELGSFWGHEAKKYDKWVNLSESVECTLLAVPGKTLHTMSPGARHFLANVNYLDLQHQMAGVPDAPRRMAFYPTESERVWARAERRVMGEFVIVYSLNGSSVHKRWPWMDRLIAAALMDFPQVHIVLVGGPDGQILEQGWFGYDKDPQKFRDAKKVQTEPRVHCRSARWEIRQTLAFLETADLVFGTETGVLNAAACLAIPKVVLLSHSTPENLVRDWVNTHAVMSEATECPGRGKNEAPACHQMHYGFGHCKEAVHPDNKAVFGELAGKPSGTAQCMYDLDFESVYRVLWHVITDALAKRKAA